MGYSKQKASSRQLQRKIDKALGAVFSDIDGDGKKQELQGAAYYLAGLFLYAHGDDRFSGVLDSISVVNYSLVTASSTVPRFFHPYLELRNNEQSHGLHIDHKEDCTAVSVSVPEIVYPYADLADKGDAVKIACFAIFQGLSMVIEPVARYQMNQQSMDWERCDNRAPIVLVMDAIVDGRVAACPQCGKPVYLKDRSNPTPFCGTPHSNTYHRRAKRCIENGMPIEQVRNEFPYIGEATIEDWAFYLNGGANNG